MTHGYKCNIKLKVARLKAGSIVRRGIHHFIFALCQMVLSSQIMINEEGRYCVSPYERGNVDETTENRKQ